MANSLITNILFKYEAAKIVKGFTFFVDILDYCEHDGFRVLVFEFVSQNLSQFISMHGSLPIRIVRSLTRQMMMALQKLKVIKCFM